MKRIPAFLLLLLYFTASTGFVVSRHFCMDRVASVELGVSGSDKCGECGMHKDGGCCRDEVTVVKLSSKHVTAFATAPVFSTPVLPAFETGFITLPFENTPLAPKTVALGPPLPVTDICISHCVFRI